MTAALYTTSCSGWGGFDVGFQPVADSVESVLPIFKYVSDKPVGFIGIAVNAIPIEPQKQVGGDKSNPLVSVKERVVCG